MRSIESGKLEDRAVEMERKSKNPEKKMRMIIFLQKPYVYQKLSVYHPENLHKL